MCELADLILKCRVSPVLTSNSTQLHPLTAPCSRRLSAQPRPPAPDLLPRPPSPQDGVLSDAELNAFQVHCFNAPLQAEELAGVKSVVAERIEQVGSWGAPGRGRRGSGGQFPVAWLSAVGGGVLLCLCSAKEPR